MLYITPFQTKDEIVRAHPNVKSFQLVHHAPRGQHTADQMSALKAKGIDGAVFQVGDFFWQATSQSTNENRTLCACFEWVGDNNQCHVHGKAGQP